ncbi:MAG: hypothetical protein M3458_13370, partial [Acidobacteriota bacterium]|nr:hypothetical protein [Acidobacteriota bacterium]
MSSILKVEQALTDKIRGSSGIAAPASTTFLLKLSRDDAPPVLFTMGSIPRQLAAALQSVNERVHSQTPQCFGFDVPHRVPVE